MLPKLKDNMINNLLPIIANALKIRGIVPLHTFEENSECKPEIQLPKGLVLRISHDQSYEIYVKQAAKIRFITKHNYLVLCIDSIVNEYQLIELEITNCNKKEN